LISTSYTFQANNFRNEFGEKKLIYAPSDGDLCDPGDRWHRTSSCIWTRSTHLSGMAGISTYYHDLKGFFVDFLGVLTPDLDMLVDELASLGNQSSELRINDAKNLIREINFFAPNERSLRKLRTQMIFPVRRRGFEPTLSSTNSSFLIIDRRKLADAFEGNFFLLDFDLEEVQKLQPFLSCFDLEDRYISRKVKERSSVEGNPGKPNANLTRNLRRRAYALFRYASEIWWLLNMLIGSDVLHISTVRGLSMMTICSIKCFSAPMFSRPIR
jgi:hypothetical protein